MIVVVPSHVTPSGVHLLICFSGLFFFFFFRCKFTSLEPRNAGMPMVVNIFVKFCVRVMENKKIKL